MHDILYYMHIYYILTDGVRGGDGASKKSSTPLTDLTTYTLLNGGRAGRRRGIEKALHPPDAADNIFSS